MVDGTQASAERGQLLRDLENVSQRWLFVMYPLQCSCWPATSRSGVARRHDLLAECASGFAEFVAVRNDSARALAAKIDSGLRSSSSLLCLKRGLYLDYSSCHPAMSSYAS